jgi:8-oxo-dGTP diphosphatase
LILVFNGDRILLQKGAQNKKIWSGKFNGLGGHVEKGEDILSSARRELQEEAGIICKDLHLSGTVVIDVDECEGILMFVLSGQKPIGEIKSSEEGIIEWIDTSTVEQLPVVEDIPMLIGKVRDANSGGLFYGHYSYDEQGKLKSVFC